MYKTNKDCSEKENGGYVLKGKKKNKTKKSSKCISTKEKKRNKLTCMHKEGFLLW